MPFVLILLYPLIELLAVAGLAHWLGFGWAFLIVIAMMFIGGIFAQSQLRALSARPDQNNPGKTAGNLGLTMVGFVLSVIPGIVTGIVGFLFILPATRALIRRGMARQLTVRMEDFGTQMYHNSPMSRRHTSYGSFSGDIIDEDPRP